MNQRNAVFSDLAAPAIFLLRPMPTFGSDLRTGLMSTVGIGLHGRKAFFTRLRGPCILCGTPAAGGGGGGAEP